MPYFATNLTPIGGQSTRGRTPGLWAYATLDTHATVDTSGYFNAAANILNVGDIIDVVVWATAIGTGGTVSTYGRHIVLSNTGTVVNTSDVTVGTVTNTD